MHNKVLTIALLIGAFFLLPGCMYRLTIQQGNIVSESAYAKLKIGMNKSQVVSILGQPVLDNAFEDNRWYYIYTQQTGTQKMFKKGVILYFRGDRLEKIASE